MQNTSDPAAWTRAAGALLEEMRRRAPLVHCLTNHVVTNFTANVLLAAGAAPAMIHDPEESAIFAGVASALLVNVGTIEREQAEAMRRAVAAANAAHAHSFIRRLPKGYDTVISDDGGALSAGQRQLLCIARVMLAIPPMLILDEATSSIDTRTELKIQNAFATLMRGRTSFIVAHRLSTIREADIILVMNAGRIIEKGTHDELLAEGGFYAKLWGSQFEEAGAAV